MQKEEKFKDETSSAKKNNLASKAPKQGDFKDKAQDIQQKAGSEAPAAAQSVAKPPPRCKRPRTPWRTPKTIRPPSRPLSTPWPKPNNNSVTISQSSKKLKKIWPLG